MTINARSLYSPEKRNEFEFYLLDNDFDILLVQETRWDSTMEDSVVNIPGFTIAARCDRVPDNQGGGCAIFTKENVMYNNAFKKSINMHTQIAGIKVKDLYIVCIYRRPHFDKKIDKLTVSFLKTKLENKKVFISGDLNLRRFNWNQVVIPGSSAEDALGKVDSRDAIWMDYMIEMDLEQLINEPTHELDGQLDVVIKNMDYDIITKTPEVRPDLFGKFTDHYAIITEVNIVIEHISKLRTVFDEKNMPWDEMRIAFEERNIEELLSVDTHAEDVWTLIRNTVFELRGELCPTKKVGFSNKSPWINEYLRGLLRKERKKRRSAYNRNLTERKRKLNKSAWIIFRNFMRTKINKARYDYEKNVICRLAVDNNSVHKYFKAKRSSHESPVIVDSRGENLYTDIEKCNRFQSHFMSVYGDYHDLQVEWKENAKFTEITLSEEKIKKVIKKMKAGTAPGLDTISSTYYKELVNQLSRPLLLLYSRVLNHNELPMDWQISKVSPLFKGSGLKSDVGRWRPLSLGCVSLRIFERVYELDFRPFLEENDLLPSFQHGFRAKKSCVTNLLSSWNMLANKVDKGHSPNVLNLDGTAAFDCLSIPEILKKLQELGIGGKAGLFIESWLTKRYQYVQINKATSYIAEVKSGVPQGSVLGPIIYILASSPGLVKAVSETNDECASLGLQNRIRILTYADDVKCSFYLRDEEDLLCVNILIEKLEEYTVDTNLRFNASKSQLLRLGAKNFECDLELSGCLIPEVKLMKDLGCWFNKGYTFIPMMNTQISKAKAVIQMVKHGLQARDTTSLKQLFQMYMQSTLLYASEVWLNIDEATITKLDEVDRKFWKLLPQDQTRPECLSSAQMAIKKNLLMFFKIKHKMAKVTLDSDFEYMQSETHTRLSVKQNLLAPKCRLAMKQKEYVSVTTKLYNLMDPIKRESKLISIYSREAQRVAETFVYTN